MRNFPRKAGIVLILLLICLPVLLFAQDDDPSVETDWENYVYNFYAPGDQTFQISVGIIIPSVFVNGGVPIKNNAPIGGTGSLIFNYYLTPKFFIGGELSGMFVPTKGKNTMFLIPLGARAGTQFIVGRFEFPISAVLGMAWHTYLDKRYYGFFMKGGGSAFFRAINNWAFGLSTDLYWLPQWTANKKENVDGLFVDITFSARYHF